MMNDEFLMHNRLSILGIGSGQLSFLSYRFTGATKVGIFVEHMLVFHQINLFFFFYFGCGSVNVIL